MQERLRRLRPSSVRPAQRTGYRPGQVLQLDWAEMPTRPRLAGRERCVYALVASLPYSGAQTLFFSLDMTIESFLEGHARAFEWFGGVPRECVYDNRRQRDDVVRNRRFLHLPGNYGFHATACTPATPREKGQSRQTGASSPDPARAGLPGRDPNLPRPRETIFRDSVDNDLA